MMFGLFQLVSSRLLRGKFLVRVPQHAACRQAGRLKLVLAGRRKGLHSLEDLLDDIVFGSDGN